MSATPAQLAAEIHAQGVKFVIAVTGGGSRAISDLLTVSGASRSILAAHVPYAEAALVEFLGGKPDEFCSPATARAMAMAAYIEARRYAPGEPARGVALTASLASDRPKRGPHRAHAAWQSDRSTVLASLEIEKGLRTRAEEESLVAAMLLNLAAEAASASSRVELSLSASERLQIDRVDAPAEQQDLLAGRAQKLAARGDGTLPAAILSGAFNPRHEGHLQMANVAGQILGEAVGYELSMINVDKPPLDFIELAKRLGQFSDQEAVWVSRAPTFVEKAELFPGVTFVVGADTIVRVGQDRYYGGRSADRDAAIARIAAAGCNFLVFGRVIDGHFQTLPELPVPPQLIKLCREVPADAFRQDISSTQLRTLANPG